MPQLIDRDCHEKVNLIVLSAILCFEKMVFSWKYVFKKLHFQLSFTSVANLENSTIVNCDSRVIVDW